MTVKLVNYILISRIYSERACRYVEIKSADGISEHRYLYAEVEKHV